MPDAPRIGSLCSGYGGLEMGLTAVIGGSVAWHVEYDKHPSAVLEARFPGVPNYGDITTTDWTQVEPVDWLTAGYPCQPFSHAGKRRGSNDERHLWPDVAHAIGVLRPRRVLLENVAGHVSLGLDAVLADLAALGYDATWGVVRAADAGAPHGRARIFVIAADTTTGGRGWPQSVKRGMGAAECLAPAAPHPEHDGCTGATVIGSAGTATTPGRSDRCGGTRRRRGRPANGVAGYADQPDTQGRLVGATGSRSAESAARGSGGAAADPDVAGGEALSGRQRARDARRLQPVEPCGTAVEWGAYAPAIRRWEYVTGRPAPRPTEPGRTGERLSPRFVEWLMGLPDGWVTDILGRGSALKCLGNGVVPQQAALAVRTLLTAADSVGQQVPA